MKEKRVSVSARLSVEISKELSEQCAALGVSKQAFVERALLIEMNRFDVNVELKTALEERDAVLEERETALQARDSAELLVESYELLIQSYRQLPWYKRLLGIIPKSKNG